MFVGAFGAGATAASASGVRGDTHAKFPVMRRFLANTKAWLWPRRSPAAATLNSAARSWISLRPLFPREPRRGQSNALNGIAKRYRSSSGPCPVAVGGGRGRLLDGHRVGRRKGILEGFVDRVFPARARASCERYPRDEVCVSPPLSRPFRTLSPNAIRRRPPRAFALRLPAACAERLAIVAPSRAAPGGGR